jgi:hypothetical protein
MILIMKVGGFNKMAELVQFPIFQTYGKYLSEDEIKTDAVKTIQKRLMSLNEESKIELGITNDFIDENNLFNMIDNKSIVFEYDGERSSIEKPAYRIKIDYDNDGTYYELVNPDESTLYAPYDFSGKKPDYLEFNPSKLRISAYDDEWNEGFDERKKNYDRIIGTDDGIITTSRRKIAEKIRRTMFNLKHDLHNLGKEGAEIVSNLIPGFDYNYDNWEEQSQKILKRINVNEDLGITNTNAAYNFIIENEENGVFKPIVYENIKGDPSIGYGLSLKNEFVINELKKRGYNIDKLMNKTEELSKKDGEEITDIKVNEARKITLQKFKNKEIDLSGVNNSHLRIALIDLQYQGLLGSGMIEAVTNYINTGDQKYMGTFSPYNADGSALRNTDPKYATREVTILQELYNDGLAAKDKKQSGTMVRMHRRAKLIMSWAEGQYTNLDEGK